MIELRNVTKSYMGMRPILDGATLRVERGDFFYLTGVSGAGKTTVFKLLMLLEQPDSGSVLVDGEDVSGFRGVPRAHHRRGIGMVFQDYRLLAALSIEENVALPLRIAGLRGKVLREHTEVCMARVGLVDRRWEVVKGLSGGEQQLVAIARATAFDPPILLADEPTGNLDQNMAHNVMEVLRELNQQGATVIVEPRVVVIVNALRQPWGRIVIQKPDEPEMMLVLGLSEDVIVLPADEVTLMMELRDARGIVLEKRRVTLRAGGRYVVTWKSAEDSTANELRSARKN